MDDEDIQVLYCRDANGNWWRRLKAIKELSVNPQGEPIVLVEWEEYIIPEMWQRLGDLIAMDGHRTYECLKAFIDAVFWEGHAQGHECNMVHEAVEPDSTN